MATTTATPEALAFYRAAQHTLTYLAGRWRDESKYENIDLYLLPLSEIANKAGVVLAGMTKRPFGVLFRVGGREFHAFFKGHTYQYKRTA